MKLITIDLILFNFVIVLPGIIRAAVIAPEWADVRFNPCAKVSNLHFLIANNYKTFGRFLTKVTNLPFFLQRCNNNLLFYRLLGSIYFGKLMGNVTRYSNKVTLVLQRWNLSLIKQAKIQNVSALRVAFSGKKTVAVTIRTLQVNNKS